MPVKEQRMRRIKMLDGLKGLSILAIIFYYFFQHLLPGGFLAVNTFFLISGFLSFRHFYARDLSQRPMEVGSFYKRRFSRLFFPMLAMIMTTTTYIFLFKRDFLFNLRNMALSGLTFVNNFYQIWHEQSYFVQAANPSPFVHLWYVSLLAQLLILTPVIFQAFYRWHKKPTMAINLLLVTSALSAVLLGYWYTKAGDPSSVYYNLVTRSFSYLLGGAIGLLYPAHLTPKDLPDKIKHGFSLAGLIFLILGFIMLKFMYGTAAFTYQFGMLLFTLCMGGLVIASMHPDTLGAKILSFPVFTWFGARSYSYYLWYYPIHLLFPTELPFLGHNLWLYSVIKFLVIVLVAEGAYQLFEKERLSLPIGQDFNWQKMRYQIRYLMSHPGEKRLIKGISFTYAFILIVGTIGLGFAPETKGLDQEETLVEESTPESTSEDEELEEEAEERPNRVINHVPGLSQQELLYANALEVTFVGDSQLLAGEEEIRAVFPQALVDASVGRQLYQSMDIVYSLSSQDLLSPTVVTFLGANGTFTSAQINDYIEAIGTDREQYFLTIGINKPWVKDANRQIQAAAQRYDNIKVIDWASYVQDHPEWLAEDDIHLTLEGNQELAKFIAQEIYRQR